MAAEQRRSAISDFMQQQGGGGKRVANAGFNPSRPYTRCYPSRPPPPCARAIEAGAGALLGKGKDKGARGGHVLGRGMRFFGYAERQVERRYVVLVDGGKSMRETNGGHRWARVKR